MEGRVFFLRKMPVSSSKMISSRWVMIEDRTNQMRRSSTVRETTGSCGGGWKYGRNLKNIVL